MNRRMLCVIAVAVLSGCAGKVDYTPPLGRGSGENSVSVKKSKDAVWKGLVAELGKKFFVINNIDKESGLINVSYSGDPERYIDCGMVTSYVKNLAGERTYVFPGARARQQYETMTDTLYKINRELSLEGRMNIIVSDIDGKSTNVSANTKYIVTRKAQIYNPQGIMVGNLNDTINFNTGGVASFPGTAQQTTTCQPTGQFEQDVIALAK